LKTFAVDASSLLAAGANGWQCRGIGTEADVLLLDEPTNHLD